MGNLGHIGPYELLGELGRGAMARVWRGWDPRLEREVAVKEPLFNSSYSPEVIAEMGQRFVAEAKAAARLTHPHIVTVYDADVWDGRAAIVMELVQGETLAQTLTRGPLPADLALQVLDELLDAVGYAHSKGVVHRDIKPENIFLTSRGGVKLADFGVAHVDDGATRATVAGAVIGTPGYMSPEQAVGRLVDDRSDLFSIGILAYEMLAGYGPFSSGNPDAPTLLYRNVHEPAPELPAFVLSSVPQHVTATIASALEKDPLDRPQSAEEFRAMLRGEMAVRSPGERTVANNRTIIDNDTFRNVDFGTGSTAYQQNGSQAGFSQNTSGSYSTKDLNAEGTYAEKKSVSSWLPYAAIGTILVLILAFILFNATSGCSGGGGSTGSTSSAESAVTPNTPPIFAEAKASSELPPDQVVSSYGPRNVLTDDTSTAWNEGAEGDGVGEWIYIYSPEPQGVSGIYVINGFPKSERVYNNNNRCKDITIELSDGAIFTTTLSDEMGSYQQIDFGGMHSTTYVRITINSVYKGTKWNDCSLCAVKPY
ncbi:MAG: protein kinase [Coriobacteriales bacterium]|nr:protein kinase [Coriobacteriales bacterium]